VGPSVGISMPQTKIYGMCVKKKIKMAFPLSEKQYE
jgi:hypothetical protein